MRFARACAGMVMGLAALHAAAQQPSVPVESDAVRAALVPFKDLMQRLPAPLRERLLAHARTWVALAPAEQVQLRENLSAWEDLEPQQKLALRERFEAWGHLDVATQTATLAAAERFAQLPDEARQHWQERFAALDPAQRRQFLFAPSNRSAMELANELFPFIPAAEHAATLTMLRELTPEEVTVLRRQLARLPPARRDAQRQQLLELDPAARSKALGDGS